VKRGISLLAALALASCAPESTRPDSPAAPVTRPPAQDPSIARALPVEIPAPSPSPAHRDAPSFAPRVLSTRLQGIAITAVCFDSRTHEIRILDQPRGPGSVWGDAETAGSTSGALAVINAGFFTPNGEPLGLIVSQGARRGNVNRASSLGAGFFIGGPSPALIRREAWQGATEAVQAGPFLVEQGRKVGGLSPEVSTARSFIATDGGTHWFIGRTGACSLAELGAALATGRLAGDKIATALNFDGGRSSDLWVGSQIEGGPLHQRPIWNKPVRNFAALFPR
jgi:uncharacterized protein YigE (DUF2233 family)